jgi:hypothetical protein
VWTSLNKTRPAGDGSTLISLTDPGQWKTANSTRAISVGSGYTEFTLTSGDTRVLYFGQYGVYFNSSLAYLMANGNLVAGPYSVSAGSIIRLDVTPSSAEVDPIF